MRKILLLFFSISLFSIGCSISPKPGEIAKLEENKEFENVIDVKEIEAPPPVPPATGADASSEGKSTPAPSATNTSGKERQKKKDRPSESSKSGATSSVGKSLNDSVEAKEVEQENPSATKIRLPGIEDDEGFDGRRPKVDPFKVGEVLTFDVSYGVISAGQVQLKTHPFVEVNGRRSYHFSSHVDSNSVFSFFYKVNDWAETYVDYETLVPYSFSLHVRESKQFKEAQNYFDWQKLQGQHWEKKLKRGKMRERKTSWEILPYSQNVLSAFFYLRTFQYRPGKKMMFRVADDGKNLVTTVDVIQEEEIDTPAGRFMTTKSEVNFEYDGVFKPVGSVLLWMTTGPEKYIARIDAKIKIGTLSISLEKIERPEE